VANFRAAVLRAFIAFGIGVLSLCLAAAALIYIVFSPSRDEVSRIASPSGDLVATVVEVNGGALISSFGYEIHVSRVGFNLGSTEVASLYGAVRSDRAYGVNLRWVSNKELRVEYLDAESAELVSSSVFGPSVRVVLQPGISDTSAPRGGMLYNLQGKPSLGG
jgi:hypothetical protein